MNGGHPSPPIPRSAPKRKVSKHRQAAHEHGQICDHCGGTALLITKANGCNYIQCQRGACGAELMMATNGDTVKQATKALKDYLDAKRRNPSGSQDLQLKGAVRQRMKAKAQDEMADAFDRLCKILRVGQ